MLLFFLACAAGSVTIDPDRDGTKDPKGDSADTATTVDATDTEDSEDSGTTAASFADLSATIHPVMGSIVELRWTQVGDAEVQARFHVGTEDALETPTYTLGDGPHRLLLLGAPFGEEVAWTLFANGAPVQAEATIRTDDPPEDLHEADSVTGDPTAWDPALRHLLVSITANASGGSPERAWTFIVDRKGRPVWAEETPRSRTTFMPMVSVSGTEILIDQNSWWGAFDGGVNSQVVRFDIEGNELGTYDTPGMIHPFTQNGAGDIIYGASLGSSYEGESLDIATAGGDHDTLWDCNDWARSHGEGVCGSNALFWDAATDNVLFSLYSAETVVEVTPSGDAERWFGHARDSWGFADGSHEFYWQHGAHLLSDGHLLLSSRVDDHTEETMAIEYALDEAREELVEVWSFGLGEEVWAYIMGEARRLDSGHTLHNYGSTRRIREIDLNGDVVWDLSYDDGNSMGRMTALPDLYAFWHDSP